METDKKLVNLFVLSIGVIMATEMMGHLLISFGKWPSIGCIGVIRTVQIICMLGLVHGCEKGGGRMGLALDQSLQGIKRGVIWSAVFGGIAFAALGIMWAADMCPFNMFHTRFPSDKRLLILYFMVGGCIGPVAEEIFFRGIVYRFFRQWGILMGVSVSTLVFVALHGLTGIPVTQIVGGVIFALSYEKEKNLYVPIIIHVSGNISIFLLSLLSS